MNSENVRMQALIKNQINDIKEISSVLAIQDTQLKANLESEKVNIFKMVDKLRRDLMDSFLIVTENIYEGDNLTITKKNIRHYTIEKVDLLQK